MHTLFDSTAGQCNVGFNKHSFLFSVIFLVVSTITCPRTGSVHKSARRLMNIKGIDADHPQPKEISFKFFF